MISLLIDNKANPNIRFSENFIQWNPKDGPYLDLKYPSEREITPLEYAFKHKAFNILKLLIEKKANVNKKNDLSETPLHLAVKNHQLEIVKILIKNKADVNAIDVNGCTALDIDLNNESSIEEDKWKRITKILLKAGNGKIKDKKEVEHCFIDSIYRNE